VGRAVRDVGARDGVLYVADAEQAAHASEVVVGRLHGHCRIREFAPSPCPGHYG